MTERILRTGQQQPFNTNFNNSNNNNIKTKIESDLSPRKTMLVLFILVGCFAVLWPKVFYPMLIGSATQHMKPSAIDKTTGCCDVISESDINTIKIMSELCKNAKTLPDKINKTLTQKELIRLCKEEILHTCGIDISDVLQEQIRIGQNVKQILDQVRSLNGSLCLKYNFGVSPWKLGVPHRITINLTSPSNIRQERPLNLRSELVHPAFRERGRAIPQTQAASPSRPLPRMLDGRPGPLPGMRPTIGGAGHVVPPSKHQSASSMSIIMPIYTIGIVIFFTYTLMKVLFRKAPQGVNDDIYSSRESNNQQCQREVYETKTQLPQYTQKRGKESKLVVNAMSALLDQVDQEMEAERKANESSKNSANGKIEQLEPINDQQEIINEEIVDDQPTVTVMSMEMQASCENGKKWTRPESPISTTPTIYPHENVPIPQEIFLEGALPPQSHHLLVADAAVKTEKNDDEDDTAVVLSGKMTLSVISSDNESNDDDSSDEAAKDSNNLCEEQTLKMIKNKNEEIKNDDKKELQESIIYSENVIIEDNILENDYNIDEDEVDGEIEEIIYVSDDECDEIIENELNRTSNEITVDTSETTPELDDSEEETTEEEINENDVVDYVNEETKNIVNHFSNHII